MAFSPDTYSSIGLLSVPFAPVAAVGFDDSDLSASTLALAEIARRVNTAIAMNGAELERRSRPELGDAGLAQRLGARTPQKLVQILTGSTKGEAFSLIQVGKMMDATAPEPATPWLACVAEAVSTSNLSVSAAAAIQTGLGVPTADVTGSQLAHAAHTLVDLARGLTVEQLAIHARDLRAELDLTYAQDRETALRDKRYLRLTQLTDGMTRISGLLDPESAAVMVAAYDGAISPRRGGPRFVEKDAAQQVDALDDTRTTDQIAVDAFVGLIRIACGADESTVLVGNRTPVQVLVTESDLLSGVGLGRIEGQTEPISLATVQRHICDNGLQEILFNRFGEPLGLSPTQRLFTRKQRIAFAARDGGCRFPDCDRPPSWCEAHHIIEYSQGGPTDLSNGILLCKHHHLLVHNAGWQIIRNGPDYTFIPPATRDPLRTPIPSPSRSRTHTRMLQMA